LLVELEILVIMVEMVKSLIMETGKAQAEAAEEWVAQEKAQPQVILVMVEMEMVEDVQVMVV
jgi:hypothetical protein